MPRTRTDRTPWSSRPRRIRGRSALVLAAALLLVAAVACSDGDDTTDESSTGGKPAGSADPAAGPFPLTVEHALGTTEVEEEPERVVSVGYTEQDTILALGVTPVGVTDWYGDQPFATWPWAQEALGDAEPEVLGAEPVYNALEAVSSGDLVFTDGVTAGAIYFTSPLSLPFVLEQLVPALEQVVAGEGPVTIDAS